MELIRRKNELVGLSQNEVILKAFLSGKGESTLRAYAKALDAYCFFVGMKTIGAALEDLIEGGQGVANLKVLEFRNHMVESDLAPATINLRLSVLRSLTKLARMLGAIAWVVEVPNVKHQAYKDTKGAGVENVNRLVAKASEAKRDEKAARDVALIRLMFDLGLRCCEVSRAKIEDVDFENRRFWVLGKGERVKTPLSLPKTTAKVLKDWIRFHPLVKIQNPSENPLFCSLAHNAISQNHLTTRGIHKIVKTLGVKIDIDARPHGLRHSAVTALLNENGGNIVQAQKFARHASPNTTMVYYDNLSDIAGKGAKIVSNQLKHNGSYGATGKEAFSLKGGVSILPKAALFPSE